MKLELKENMYIRTKNGNIRKIVELTNTKFIDEPDYYVDKVLIDIEQNEREDTIYMEKWLFKETIVKSSLNIIDLIEVGDYVNGSKVIDISIIGKDKEKWVWIEQMEDTDNKYGDDYVGYNNEQIKSIVTKEQMEQMAYKVGGVNDNTAKNE